MSAAQGLQHIGGPAASIAQDYKRDPLRQTDFLRYPNFHQALQQKIASFGAATYLQVDALGAPVFRAPNTTLLAAQYEVASTRFLRQHDLLLQEAAASQQYNAHSTAYPEDNVTNVANWLEVQASRTLLTQHNYSPADDARLRFLTEARTGAARDQVSMQKATGQVFEWILASVESTLGTRVIELQSRTGPGTSPHTNLIDSIAMLTREMAGNVQSSREACLDLLNKIKPATTVAGVRFLIDSMVSVDSVIESSILLHGGNGRPTSSQLHYKLCSKLDPTAPAIVSIRFRLEAIPDTTPITQIRALLKPHLDRECHPAASLHRSSSLAPSRAHGSPNASHFGAFNAMIDAYNAAEGEGNLTQQQANRAVEAAAWEEHHAHVAHEAGQHNLGTVGGLPAYDDLALAASGRPPYGSRGPPPRSASSRTPVCSNFLWDTCERGDSCRFSHPQLNELKGLLRTSSQNGSRVPPPPPPPSALTLARRPPPGGRGKGPLGPSTLSKRPPSPARGTPAVKRLSFANHTQHHEAAAYEYEEQPFEDAFEEGGEGSYEK